MLRISVLAAETTEWVSGLALAAVIGAYGAIAALYNKVSIHTENSDHHPSGNDLVWKDTCDERVKRIEQKIDNQTKLMAVQFEELKGLILSRNADP